MPRISTDNYDTVASWNGSQDLFVVEQPDGTKVATPAMVKQFIEAGDFEATGEVKDGHGNILKDMAKSADVATALAGKQNTLTFDDTPTENSTNPVKSGGVFTALAGKQDNLIVASGKLASTAGTITIPYPTGVSKNTCYTVGWNILLNGSKYSGYSMGHSGTMLTVALNDSNISVYNNDTSFYGSWIYIILAKM